MTFVDRLFVRWSAALARFLDMGVTADGHYIDVASRWAKKLTVIDAQTRQLVRQINVGKSPHGVWMLDHVARQ